MPGADRYPAPARLAGPPPAPAGQGLGHGLRRRQENLRRGANTAGRSGAPEKLRNRPTGRSGAAEKLRNPAAGGPSSG